MTLRTLWGESWKDRAFRIESIVTVVLLVGIVSGLANFLQVIERRPGAVLNDPVLAMFQPVDLTWVTFALIYGGLLLAIGILLSHPRRLMIAFQCYSMMVIVRMIAMSLTPLDPPPTMIALVDPTVSYFGTGMTPSRDLFFSGHTSTMLLLALTVPSIRWRNLFAAATVAVAVCVLAQHAHYTIDVFAAVFFAYGSYAMVLRAREALSLSNPSGPGGTL
jgi:hypothetical protein